MPTWEEIAEGFNMWLECYIENPEAFEDTDVTISKALTEANNGETPSYGARCAALLERYIKEV